MTEAFVGKLAASPHDYFAVVDAEGVALDTMLERAPGAICRVVRKGDRVALHAPGTQIDGPARIAPALHFIARTRRFTAQVLAGKPDVRRQAGPGPASGARKLLTVVNKPADADDQP